MHGRGGPEVGRQQRREEGSELRCAGTDRQHYDTPRVIYQDVKVDGYNRQDDWNMLANEFTTTQPAVLIGEREQYRQFPERFDDQFMLSDLTMEFDLGGVLLTSISSYTERDILVTRSSSPAVSRTSNLGGDGDESAGFEAV
jgi:iron complex outermembrane receptor protein